MCLSSVVISILRSRTVLGASICGRLREDGTMHNHGDQRKDGLRVACHRPWKYLCVMYAAAKPPKATDGCHTSLAHSMDFQTALITSDSDRFGSVRGIEG
jgi:hypothetical protein